MQATTQVLDNRIEYSNGTCLEKAWYWAFIKSGLSRGIDIKRRVLWKFDLDAILAPFVNTNGAASWAMQAT